MTTTESDSPRGGHILEHNRFRWANRLDIPIPSYGAPPEVVYVIALPISILPVGLAHKSLLKTWQYVQWRIMHQP
ncbi:MAG: hypothetical protein F4W68_02790 [Cenarchaeum sp. SB0661_bin_35]|nr:hypothetical protein [Cenarchaeum sp. SB0667_bin_13]MYC79413.1 hypothetical protein [Cenarchaeum sp. SB0661_bin_35]MYD58641.1 hypothetical protein [Cenarchaeum sp. SB0678_bin_8]MYI51508.1 hypothetical protein [Cenarchaeum sp. SB0673_bin_9]